MFESNPYKSIFANEMYGYLKLLDSASKSLEIYKVTFKSLDAYLVKHNVQEKSLNEELIAGHLRTLTCKPQTKNRRIGNLRQFCRYLHALEIPAYEPEYLCAHQDFTAYTFTDEEFEAIIEAADNFATVKRDSSSAPYIFPILLRLLYGCGLRIGEALELHWNDIDFDRNVITIKKAKNNKQRLVPMHSSLADVLKQYQERQALGNPDVALLFESSKNHGKPFLDWTFRNWFLKILEAAGLTIHRKAPFDRSISTHTLRHYFTYKSFLQSEDNGRKLEQTAPFLSAYLGHESLFGTEKYLTTDYTLYESSQQRRDETIGALLPEVNFE